MTSEKRILIAPADIISAGFECPRCGATYFVPIDKLDREMPRNCQNCNESIFTNAPVVNSDYSDLQIVAGLITFLKAMRNRTFGSAIRFEIREEPSDEAAK